MGKEPDRAWEQGHKGQGMGTEPGDMEMGRGIQTEYGDKETEQKIATGTEMRGSMGIGQSMGREMGQGMATKR